MSSKISPAAEFQGEVFVAEPNARNPVTFYLDEHGRAFVSETYRYRSSVLDIWYYMGMLDDDLACHAVEDRLKMTEKHFGAEPDSWHWNRK